MAAELVVPDSASLITVDERHEAELQYGEVVEAAIGAMKTSAAGEYSAFRSLIFENTAAPGRASNVHTSAQIR